MSNSEKFQQLDKHNAETSFAQGPPEEQKGSWIVTYIPSKQRLTVLRKKGCLWGC